MAASINTNYSDSIFQVIKEKSDEVQGQIEGVPVATIVPTNVTVDWPLDSTVETEKFTIENTDTEVYIKDVFVCVADVTGADFQVKYCKEMCKKWNYPREGNDKAYAIAVLIINKRERQSAYVAEQLYKCRRHFNYTLLVKPEDQDKIPNIIREVVGSKAFRQETMDVHTCTGDCLTFADVTFNTEGINKEVLTAIVFGDGELNEILESRGTYHLKTQEEGWNHRISNFLEVGYEWCELDEMASQGLMPKWKTVMPLPSKMHFALIFQVTLEKCAFAKKPSNMEKLGWPDHYYEKKWMHGLREIVEIQSQYLDEYN